MAIAYIGLGSNLGDRFTYLQTALHKLSRLPHTAVVAVSCVYETPPLGVVHQPAFLNAVAKLQTTLAPADLLEHLKAIERQLGRPKHYARWSARIIDLDILLYDDLVMQLTYLTIPHPELTRRKFAMQPLLDLADPIHPLLQQPISNLLEHTEDTSNVTALRQMLQL
jgi:2-amino-4-hydroxy-6-hydroxymethyldihydropteridine diphosphokinase